MMKPAPFRLIQAHTVDEVFEGLTDHENAKVLAGGQSLVPLMNFRLSRPDVLIDISQVGELRGIQVTGSQVRIGALTRHEELAHDAVIHQHLPVLARAAHHIGHWAIRNRGTLGGSVAHADPAAELPAALVALNAQILVRSAQGERRIAAEDFFLGYYMTALSPEDLITGIEFPVNSETIGFSEVVRRPGDFALVGAYVERHHAKGALTWFGLGAKPERMVVEVFSESSAARTALFHTMATSVITEEQDAYKASMAASVAERAYQQAERGHS